LLENPKPFLSDSARWILLANHQFHNQQAERYSMKKQIYDIDGPEQFAVDQQGEFFQQMRLRGDWSNGQEYGCNHQGRVGDAVEK
jgi:hypothetical protein